MLYQPIDALEPRVVLSTYYVARNGSNSNRGTLARPLKTIAYAASSVASSGTREMAGTVLRNNLFTNRLQLGGGAVTGQNLGAGSSFRFVNAAAGDFRLLAGSAAIDAGGVLARYTDGFLGAAPDAGIRVWRGGVGCRGGPAGAAAGLADSAAAGSPRFFFQHKSAVTLTRSRHRLRFLSRKN